MAKPEWGLKRVCPNCGTRYYDMHHDPIICPKCGAAYDAEAVVKTRRARAQAVSETVIEPIVAEEVDPELANGAEGEEVAESLTLEGESDEDTDIDTEGEDNEDEDVLEDASELGEDEDDMAEVIDNVDEEDDR